MRNLTKDALHLNAIGEFLAKRDIPELTSKALQEKYGVRQADVLMLFGGSIPYGCELAGRAYKDGIAKKLMIIGGEGHTTDHLRFAMKEAYPQINVTDRMESEIISDYFYIKFGIDREEIILEKHSTNCGENVLFTLDVLRELHQIPETAIVMQDSSMQARMDATFKKVWTNQPTQFIHFAAYLVSIKEKDNRLVFDEADSYWGMWPIERHIQLLLGEMQRLTDDANGYGPNGKNYIAHVDIPEHVNAAYLDLQEAYQEFIRKPWLG